MQMTKERKIYVGLFGLAAVALGVDKFVLDPSDMPAARAEVPADVRPAVVTESHVESAVPATAKQPGLAALTSQMDRVSQALNLDSAEVCDLFQTPAGWVKPAAPKQQVDVTANFTVQHHLLAVLKSSHGGIAVIGGTASRKSLRIGQQIDGFKLAAIGERSVTFTSGTQTVELQLPTDSGGDSQIITTSGR